MPTITQLEYVVALDQCRHFGRAATMCHVSQPSLSAQLQKLEDELGVYLFDRGKKPILPTEEGQAIIEQAKVILNEVQRLKSLADRDADDLSGDFRLAVIPTIAPFLVPRILDRFTERCPNVELYLEEQPSEAIIKAMDRDQIHAGVVATPLGLTRVEEEPLYYEPLLFYAHPNHRLARLKRVPPSSIKSDDLWLLSEEHCLREQVIVVCGSGDQKGCFPSVHMKGGSMETVIELVSRGRGYTLLPLLAAESVVERCFEGVVVPIASPTPVREVSIVHRRGYLKQGIIRALKATIDECVPKKLPRKKSSKMKVLSLMGQFK